MPTILTPAIGSDWLDSFQKEASNLSPPTEPASDWTSSFVAEGVKLATQEDDLFNLAPTDSARRHRWNQIRSEYGLPESDAAPPPPLDEAKKADLALRKSEIAANAEPKGFAETTLGNTLPGYAGRAIARGIVGEDYMEPPPADFGAGGNFLSEIGSIALDPSIVALGGLSRIAAKGAAKVVGREVLPKIAEAAVKSGTVLAGLEGGTDVPRQYVETGKVNPFHVVKRAAHGAALGTVAGPAGLLGKAAIPAEVAAFGVGSPLLEGRLPTTDDFVSATKMVLGLRGIALAERLVRRLKSVERPDEQVAVLHEILGAEQAQKIEAEALRLQNEKIIDLLKDHDQRVAAGQKDAMPTAKMFEEAGLGRPTRKERPAILQRIKENADAVEKGKQQGGGVVEHQGTEGVGPEAIAGRSDRAIGSGQVQQEVQAETQAAPVLGAPAAEAAAAQADIELNAQRGMAAGIAPQIPGSKPRGDFVPDVAKVPEPDVERRLDSARGVTKETAISKIKTVVKAAFRKSTRTFEELPKQFAEAKDILRRAKDIPNAVADEMQRRVAAIIDPLGPKQLQLFERKLIADNMKASVARGEPLRFGFTMESLKAWSEQVDAAASKVPEIQTALATRKAVVNEFVNQLVKADLLPETALANAESYFHQQVNLVREAHRMAGGRGLRPQTKSFQKKRVKGESLDEPFDYNTSYIESEVEWMTDAMASLKRQQLLGELKRLYDIMPVLRSEAKRLGVDWEELVPGTHETWQPKPGNTFFKATTIPEKIAEFIQEEGFGEVDAETLRTVLALGGPRTQYVIPKELSRQLDLMEKPKLAGPVGKFVDGAMTKWKQHILFNPLKLPGYMTRNLTGDIDPVLASAPGVFKFVPRAFTDIQKYFGNHLSVSPELKAARDLGVVSSSLTSVEMAEVKNQRIFRRFSGPQSTFRTMYSAPVNAVRFLYTASKTINEARESILRYSAFLYYKEKLASGTLLNYGGSRKVDVQAVQKAFGVDAAAAKLSRELLGDYGDMTVAGEWLRRRLIPFWSWQEINVKRTPWLLKNAAEEAMTRGRGGKAEVAGRLGLAAIVKTGAFAAFLLPRVASLYGIQYAWNHLMYPDAEQELGSYDQSNPHLILGRKEDGAILVLRNTGALGDVMEWLGLNTLSELYPAVRDGQMTWGTLFKELAKDPVNKVVSGIRPDYKLVHELLTGTSTFPDTFNPRSVAPDEAIANTVGMRDVWLAAKGAISQEGVRARPHFWNRVFPGVSDPRRNDLYELRDLVDRYQALKGKPQEPVTAPSRARNMREAAMANDFKAFEEAKQAYLKEGGTFKGFKQSASRIDPVGPELGPSDEYAFINEFLTDRQRAKLRSTREFAQDIKTKMLLWWWDAEKN